jgi:predicted lipoprotein
MKYKKILTIAVVVIVCIGLAIVSWIYGFTVVSGQEEEKVVRSEVFDPGAFVNGIWESKIIPTITEKAIELSVLLGEMKPDDSGFTSKDSLIPITNKYGRITVGEAHVYMVKGQGKIVGVDTESSAGTLELSLDGYTGPIKVKLYIGPRIPSDESSVRDAVGFINFGDFREQTEYGKVAAEINNRSLSQVDLPSDKDSLQGKTIRFYGAFTIRTFNLVEIDLKEIKIVPIRIDIVEVTQ